MSDNFDTRQFIGMVHPTMIRAMEMKEIYGKEYESAKAAFCLRYNVPRTDTEVCREHGELIINKRLNELAREPLADPKFTDMYTYLKESLAYLHKDTLVDLMVYDSASQEIKPDIERFLAMKYGSFLKTLRETSRYAYRL